jgi:hypothetical protein
LLKISDKVPSQGLNWITQQLSLEPTDPRYLYFTENFLSKAIDIILQRGYDFILH